MIQVFSTGGGTQSTAIARMICDGLLPKPDICVIADTGREMPSTFEYMRRYTMPALGEIGIEVHIVRAMDFASKAAKGIFHQSGSLMIPAFTTQSGELSKLGTYCSNEWKKRVIDRWLKQVHGISRSEYRKWIGFSRDEHRRIKSMRKGDEYQQGLIWFPLVEGIPTTRYEAIRLVERAGWPTPPRSRCTMCPHQSDAEWAEVQELYPHQYHRAVQLDRAIRIRDQDAFLHSSGKPLSEADLSKKDDLFSGSCPSGECFI